MVKTRTGRKRLKNSIAMEEIHFERLQVSVEGDSSTSAAVYDLPLTSSSDTTHENPLEVRKQPNSTNTVQDSLSCRRDDCTRVQRRRSRSISTEHSLRKLDRRRSKRFRIESDGALNLREALKLPLLPASALTPIDKADKCSKGAEISSNRVHFTHCVDRLNVTPDRVDVAKAGSPNSAPAKSGEMTSSYEHSASNGKRRTTHPLRSQTSRRRNNEQETSSEPVLEEQSSASTPRGLNLGTPTSKLPLKENAKNDTPCKASARKTTPGRTPGSSRSVRFGNDSLNAVHIIPSVPTTLPFAEQMAREREAESLEASIHQATSEGGEEADQAENVVPKCGKIIIGQRYIAIDRFVRKDECKYHFLTHAHVDHFVNLNKSWKTPIYCSELTAKILPLMMGNRVMATRLLRPLKVGETHTIEPNLHVTVLDANHCLGSVMFLFEGASIPGGAVLCTGDFRADNRLLSRFDSDPSFKKLSATYISKIYLDNTHLDHSEEFFPDRNEAEKILMTEMEQLRECSILIPVFKLGREEILERLSQSFSEIIATSAHRLQVRKVCGLKGGEFSEESDYNARIRTSQRHPKQVINALKKMPDPKVVIDLSVRNDYKDIIKEKLITVPYSDHSSRKEIYEFLSRLRFGELIPTSAPMDAATTQEMMKLSREMSRPSSSCPNAAIQTHSSVRSAELAEKEVLATATPVLKNSDVFRPADQSIFRIETINGIVDLREFAPHSSPLSYKPPPPTVRDLFRICDEHGREIRHMYRTIVGSPGDSSLSSVRM
ncbi:DRMBL domain-containing protein [Trichostrongylus colubriformis]|uniref:5' exonuclease Apollo n=1 Tax=Trichostrongylus colubriformis TaxID=6319 RepID=A0AAN8FV72_TRICO